MFAAAPTVADSWLTLTAVGLALLVLLLWAGYLGVGLFEARSLARREFIAYFISPIAYVVFVVFLVVNGFLFYQAFWLLTTTGPRGTESPFQTMFGDERFWLVYLFIPPLLTMRLLAGERASGTLENLLTAPLRDWQVVLSKYLACLAFYVVLWLPTLLYLPALLGAQWPRFEPAWTLWSITLLGGIGLTLIGLLTLLPRLGTTGRILGLVLLFVGIVATAVGGWMHYNRDPVHLMEIPVRLDPAPVLTTYLGMFLAGAMFLALGLFVSSLVKDQMVAALIALALSLLFIVAGFWHPDPDSLFYPVIYFFSVPLHFDRGFTRGVIDTRPVVLYLSMALFCLFLTVRSVESRRWQ
jgi:ABC-2 type transport system permease protein